MFKSLRKIPIGLRTLKTAAAVIISMVIVEAYGATASKLIFAMLGAMAAVQPSFKESLEACFAQIVGVVFGALVSVLLLALPIPPLVASGIGVILCITLYNALRLRYAPSMPAFIVVLICTTPDIQPIWYAFGRIWDTAIGLAVGMAINTLIFPYDNSRQIRTAVQTLDRELIAILEELFDGDEHIPNAKELTQTVNALERQLAIFSNQKLFMHARRQKLELEAFRVCESKALLLVARIEILCRVEHLGRLNDENRRRLEACGAVIRDPRPLDSVQERDVVTNYHIAQILTLRRELLEALGKSATAEEK